MTKTTKLMKVPTKRIRKDPSKWLRLRTFGFLKSLLLENLSSLFLKSQNSIKPAAFKFWIFSLNASRRKKSFFVKIATGIVIKISLHTTLRADFGLNRLVYKTLVSGRPKAPLKVESLRIFFK